MVRLPDEELRELALKLGEPLKSATLERTAVFIAAGIRELRRVGEPTGHRDIQLRLANEIMRLEEQRQRIGKRLRRSRARTNVRQLTGFDLKQDHQLAEFVATTRAIWALRRFGDSVGWKLVGFDRFYVNVLSGGATQGFMFSKAGTEVELARFEREWDAGRPAVLHAITTAFRTGDISVIEHDRWMPQEIKTADEHRRGGSRQASLLRARRELLSAGEQTDVTGNRLVHLRLQAHFEHDLPAYRDALEAAAQSGIGTRRIEPRGFVLATDLERQVELGLERATHDLEVAWTEIWRPVEMGVRGRSEDRQAKSRFGVPYTSFPFAPETCARLACGYLRLVTVIDLQQVARSLRLAGFEATVTYKRPGGTASPWFQVRLGTQFMNVPDSQGERLLFEAMRPSSLASGLAEIMRGPFRPTASGLQVFPSFSDEAVVWG